MTDGELRHEVHLLSEHLVDAASRLAEASQAALIVSSAEGQRIAAEVRQRSRDRVLMRWGFVVVTLSVLLVLVQVVYIGAVQRSNSRVVKSTNTTSRQITEILAQVESCTTPEGACAKAGQKSQVDALNQIAESNLRTIVAAIICIPTSVPINDTTLIACVRKHLAVMR